jgi:hypothetical protein
MLRKWLAARRRQKADVQFRTGFLYALDRKLFADGNPLLPDNDVAAAPIAFQMGQRAGDRYTTCVQLLDLEQARRLACCQ